MIIINWQRRTGYTLIEMTIVLFIILAFLAMSVPFFANFSASTGLKTAEREIGTLLRTARSYAISRNMPYDAVFVKNTNSFWISPVTDPNGDGNYADDDPNDVETGNKVYILAQGIEFSADSRIRFASNGGLHSTTTSTSVTVRETKDATKLKTITVDSSTGAVTMP